MKFFKKKKIFSENNFPLLLMFVYWILLGIIELLKMTAANFNKLDTFNFAVALKFVAIYSFVWVLLTLPIYKVYLFFAGKTAVVKILVQIFISVFVSSLHVVTLSFLFNLTIYDKSLHGDSFINFFQLRITANFPSALVSSFTVYWVVILILFAFDYYKKFTAKSEQAVKLESQLTNARLQTLKNQLQPHFLFNAHNTISMLIRNSKHNQAVEMISKLSDLLRTSLSVDDEQFVKLQSEIDLLNKYLDIEKARFEESLFVKVNIDEESLCYLVPNLILQPIVENAFKHGISKSLGKNKIDIEIKLRNNDLNDKKYFDISIYNTGPFLKPDFDVNPGVGLSNTVERLAQVYKKEFMFSINNFDKGVKVGLSFPARKNLNE